jgi:hypothetical protein
VTCYKLNCFNDTLPQISQISNFSAVHVLKKPPCQKVQWCQIRRSRGQGSRTSSSDPTTRKRLIQKCGNISVEVRSWAYNTSHADKHALRAWISFRYLSSHNRCPHWSVLTCIKNVMSYSIQCWKNKFHKSFKYKNISIYFCIPLAWTPCI